MERLHLSRAGTTLTAAIIAVAMSVMFFLVPSTANATTQEPDDSIPAARIAGTNTHEKGMER